MEYSADQRAALAAVMDWLRDDLSELRLTLGGYAGTGKTTVIREVVRLLEGDVAVCALAGKAAYVLRSKGVEQACTLHRLIYKPAEACSDCGMWVDACISRNNINEGIRARSPQRWRDHPSCPRRGTKMRFSRVPSLPHKLVIVDEASMLNRWLVQDLESFGTKVLYVGDHGQLEPIGEDPGLMANPQLRLEEIHRQAATSSIIRLGHNLRGGWHPEQFPSDDQVQILRGSPADVSVFDVVLCGFNKTRVAVNAKVRERRGFSGPLPMPGERVVCLRNDAELGLFNGMQATVTRIAGTKMSVIDDVGTEISDIDFDPAQFHAERRLQNAGKEVALFDFGYALTVHKAQGSEWRNVCVLEQLAPRWSAHRWRYTAATRASQTLTYCTRR